MQHESRIQELEARFQQHLHRHRDVRWETIEAFLRDEAMLEAVWAMEESGGEPDVVQLPDGSIYFMDLSEASPKGRYSLCYDQEARLGRKKFPPESSAMEMAERFGVELWDEADYRAVQAIDAIDTKTSSWLRTPEEMRAKGGAIFGDRRFDRVFIYHNGAESYYQGRGWRGKLLIQKGPQA